DFCSESDAGVELTEVGVAEPLLAQVIAQPVEITQTQWIQAVDREDINVIFMTWKPAPLSRLRDRTRLMDRVQNRAQAEVRRQRLDRPRIRGAEEPGDGNEYG